MNTDKLNNLAMNDNGFIFDPATGYSYTANETGLQVLKLLAAGKHKDEILRELCEEYECAESTMESDYVHYLLMLDALDLIEYEGSNEPKA
jgi:hypothetical protein